jgi:ABC-type multidrug transport system fused ATPase/permease subunit
LHLSESLSGLATIRAYGKVKRSEKDNVERVDIEKCMYWLTVTNLRWLGIRLNFLDTLLTLAVALLVVGTRFSISPAETVVALSYIISVHQEFGWAVRQSAEVGNDMSPVERIIHYAMRVEQEATRHSHATQPYAQWPARANLLRAGCRILRVRWVVPMVCGCLSSSRRREPAGQGDVQPSRLFGYLPFSPSATSTMQL